MKDKVSRVIHKLICFSCKEYYNNTLVMAWDIPIPKFSWETCISFEIFCNNWHWSKELLFEGNICWRIIKFAWTILKDISLDNGLIFLKAKVAQIPTCLYCSCCFYVVWIYTKLCYTNIDKNAFIFIGILKSTVFAKYGF